MPDREIILAEIAAEVARRKKFWIGGVPLPGDMIGIERHVAHRLRITWQDVKDAIAEDDA